MDPRTPPAPVPAPALRESGRSLHLVRYLGRTAGPRLRLPGSRVVLRLDPRRPDFWVRDDDLDFFRGRREFALRPERIDPPENAHPDVGGDVDNAATALLNAWRPAAEPSVARPPGSGGARPRWLEWRATLVVHLYRHVRLRWTQPDIAAAMGLSWRAVQEHLERFTGDPAARCAYCEAGLDPRPRGRAPSR